jgi:septal ring factor EnvC (AmiA/AmiB activator)
MQDECQALKWDLATWDAQIQGLQRALDEVSQRIADVSAELVEFEARMCRELSESRLFTRILDECYLEELLARRQEVFEAPTPSDGAMALMAAVQLGSERRALHNRVAEGIPH